MREGERESRRERFIKEDGIKTWLSWGKQLAKGQDQKRTDSTPIIQSEVSQKDKHQYSILTHIYGIEKDGNDNPVYETAKETLMYRTDL